MIIMTCCSLHKSPRFARTLLVLPVLSMFVLIAGIAPSALLGAPIQIANIQRNTPVDFQKEILPVLQRSCLACHSSKEASGRLVLESPEAILKGGDSGPAVIAGKGAESLLLEVASHQSEPVMPPLNNDVAAKALTPNELGLLKLWIDQGAKGTGLSGMLSPTRWRTLPSGSGPIYAVSISPDGQFAACSRGNQIFIYHVATGQVVTRLNDPSLQQEGSDSPPGVAHRDFVQSLTFNKQGDRLASGGFRTVKLWRYPRDVQLQKFSAGRQIVATAVSPQRDRLAIGGSDGIIQLLPVNLEADELRLAAPLTLQGHVGEIRELAFTPAGDRLISIAADKTVYVWSLDGNLTARVDTPSELLSMAVIEELTLPAKEGDKPQSVLTMATGGADNLIRLWKLPSHLPRAVAAALPGTRQLSTSADGQLAALTNESGTVRLVNATTGEMIVEWRAHPGTILDLAFGADPANAPMADAPIVHHRLATAGADGVVKVWAIALAREGEKQAPPELMLSLQGFLAPVVRVAFRPDGQQLAAGAESGAVSLWNLAEIAADSREFAIPGVVPSPVMALSSDRKLLATTATIQQRFAIVVRDLSTGAIKQTITGHEGPILALDFSRDGTKLVSGSADKTARVWNLADPQTPELGRFLAHRAEVTAVAFFPDGQQLVSGGADKTLKIWKLRAPDNENSESSEEVQDLAGHTGPIVSVVVPANNQPISAATDKTVRVWNPANGQAVRTQTESESITALALSADSNRFAVACKDRSLKVYAVAGGNAQLTMAGHQGDVTGLAFSADHSRLVSSGADHVAKVWDLTDGRLLEVLPVVAAGAKVSAGEDRLVGAVFEAAPNRLLLANGAGNLLPVELRFLGALKGVTQKLTGLAWHPNGQVVAAASVDGSVRGFNPANFQLTYTANHAAAIHDLVFSRDGQRMATAGENNQVRLWNPANGAALQPAQLAMPAPVRRVTFSTDGLRLVAGSQTGDVVVFDVAEPSGMPLQYIVGHKAAIVGLATAGTHGTLVSLAEDAMLLESELLAGRRLAGHSQGVTALAAIPQPAGQPGQVLSGSSDGSVRRWNLQSGQQLVQLNHGGPITDLAVRDDNQRWASASSNNTVKLWNPVNNQQVAELRGDLHAKALVAKLTRQRTDATTKVNEAKGVLDTAEKAVPGKVAAEKTAADALAKATQDVAAKTAMVQTASVTKSAAEKLAIEAAAVAQKAALEMQKADNLASQLTAKATELTAKATLAKSVAAANPNNANLAKIAQEAEAAAAKADAEAKTAVAAKAAPAKAATDTAQAAAVAAQKAQDAAKPFNEATVMLSAAEAALASARQVHEVAARELKEANDAVPAAKTILAKAEAFLQQSEKELTTATEAEAAAQKPMLAVAFSLDGLTVATGGDLGIVHTWDAETGQAVASYRGHAASIRSVRYLSDTVLVSTSMDQDAITWNVNPSWELERVIGNISDPKVLVDRVASVDFSHDGTRLVTGGGVPSRSGEIKVWNVADGNLALELTEPHTDAVHSVAFSPDDRFIASASADKYIRKFASASGELEMQFEGHTNYALSVAWRSGGKMLVSTGADGSIRFWNAETGDRIRTIENYTRQVSAVRFVGDSQFAVIASGQGLARMYNADNGGIQVNYSGPTDYLFSIDATSDPTNGVVVAGGYDGKLWIWRANGPLLRTVDAPINGEPKVEAASK